MVAGTIAEHWSRAGGASAELLHWSHRAAVEARSAFAYDDAARFAGQAAACAADLGRPAAERAELLIEWAAALFAAGRVPDALEAAVRGADLATSADRPDLVGGAALVVTGIGTPEIYRPVAAICSQALTQLADAPREAPLRARLLAQLAVASVEDGEPTVAADQAAEALALAESSGDTVAILDAIAARHYTIAVPGTVMERIQLAERAISLATVGNRLMSNLWGHVWRIDAAFQLGDLVTVERHLTELDLLARRHRVPLIRWHHERILIARAALLGDFAGVREHNDRAHALAERMNDSSLTTMYYACRAMLAQICGDPAELDAEMLALVAMAPPPQPLMQIGRATVAIVAGDLGSRGGRLRRTSRPPAAPTDRQPMGVDSQPDRRAGGHARRHVGGRRRPRTTSSDRCLLHRRRLGRCLLHGIRRPVARRPGADRRSTDRGHPLLPGRHCCQLAGRRPAVHRTQPTGLG